VAAMPAAPRPRPPRDELLQKSQEERTTQTWTVARWLRYWLTTRTSIRPSTLRSYSEHVERHLTPHLGQVLPRSTTSPACHQSPDQVQLATNSSTLSAKLGQLQHVAPPGASPTANWSHTCSAYRVSGGSPVC
jgi:hypothetical protein